ncbi:MAG: diaminopimelate decarboxylase [Acidimicrobiales bacterium]|nr:diaminopimelate decarboxylase [Acidimicrobiales bacterium]
MLPDTATIGDQGQLLVGGCDTLELAAEFGTPLFVYDEAHLRARCTEAVEAFGDGVAYATKAFLCRAMAQLAHECGMQLDVATAGELHVALAAGVPADRLVMHGNNKSMAELEMALTAGVGRIVVDSFDELDRLDMLAARGIARQGDGGQGPARILLRMTPGIEAHTHEFVATGQDDSKFGFTVSSGLAGKAVERAMASPAVELLGLHAHIGSQVFSIDSLRQSATIIAAMAAPYDLPELSVGGGLGVAYVDGEEGLTITQWARVVKDAVAATGCTAKVLAEPGRAIAAGAAITLYTVGTIKHLPDIRTYVAVDGGMSDNPRPVLYGSGYETFLPRAVEARRARTITVVGKHCESGDTLVRDGTVPDDIAVGDILATPVTGAYGYSMGSNYQHVLRPAVVFVADGEARQVVRRQTLDDLLRYDVAP